MLEKKKKTLVQPESVSWSQDGSHLSVSYKDLDRGLGEGGGEKRRGW